MATLGIPAHSSSTASRKLRALHEPQPPKPVIAAVTPVVSRCQSSRSGGTDTLLLSTGRAPATAVFPASSSYNACRNASAWPRPLATSPMTAPSSVAGRGAGPPRASGSGPLVGSSPINWPMRTSLSASCWPLSMIVGVDHGFGDGPREVREHHPGLGHAGSAGGDAEEAFGCAELHAALTGLLRRGELGPEVGAGVGLGPAGVDEVPPVLGSHDCDDVGALAQPPVAGRPLAADGAGQRVEDALGRAADHVHRRQHDHHRVHGDGARPRTQAPLDMQREPRAPLL